MDYLGRLESIWSHFDQAPVLSRYKISEIPQYELASYEYLGVLGKSTF